MINKNHKLRAYKNQEDRNKGLMPFLFAFILHDE